MFFFSAYGFVQEGNTHDSVTIELCVPQNNESEIARILTSRGLKLSHDLTLSPIPSQLFSALRIILMTPVDLYCYERNSLYGFKYMCF